MSVSLGAKWAGVGLTLSLGVFSCSRADETDSLFTVRDSLGISIAESPGPMWKAGDGWRVAAKPMVDIGTADGDPQYLFSRVVLGRMMPEGSFVVVNYGTRTLRAYSASGRFMWEAGGEGGGPGEFRSPFVLEVAPPDSLLVFDTSSRQLSLFGSDGTFVRSMALRVPIGGGAS